MADEKLNDRVDTAEYTKDIQKLINDGTLVFLAVFLYRPQDDGLVICRLPTLTHEEVIAMLRKFDLPRIL